MDDAGGSGDTILVCGKGRALNGKEGVFCKERQASGLDAAP